MASPPDCSPLLTHYRAFSSNTASEKGRKRGDPAPPKEFKPQGRPSPAQVPLQTGPRQRRLAGHRALGRRGWVPAKHTHWAEPTLLSLFASTLAGFVSSTSCCSSVIGASCGGHLQAFPQRLPASGAQALRSAPSPALSPCARGLGASRPARRGWAANLDTSGPRRLVGSGVRAGEGRGGKGRAEAE